MKRAIKAFLPAAEAIQRLLNPHAEVVIHDIKQNKIVAIYHPFSKRRVGDSSLLTQEEEIAALEDCVGPYEKINWDGRKLKSVSSVIRDENNKAVGLMCINLDISKLEKYNKIISEFIDFERPQPAPLFKDDWQERINKYVHHYLSKHQLTLVTLRREDKKKLIEHLHRIGAFSGKNSARYIAQIIKTSRATVYNYLAEHSNIER
ncbi:MAG: PAS domain-containing protein [Gammaproteobacteria bacterium]|jgi:predicted transcriptional regulator YheO|nr:PAS domain-containing protein [Gammaproteobacteria bacterium]